MKQSMSLESLVGDHKEEAENNENDYDDEG